MSKDAYSEARHGDRALARTRMARAGFADGGKTAKPIPTPTPRPAHGKEGMGEIEGHYYDVLKSSPKGWSDDEARTLATNPAGRLDAPKGTP